MLILAMQQVEAYSGKFFLSGLQDNACAPILRNFASSAIASDFPRCRCCAKAASGAWRPRGRRGPNAVSFNSR